MKYADVDYGMKIIVHSVRESTLFLDMADRQRYMSTIARMICKKNSVKIEPLIAGMKKDVAWLVFRGGTEEYFKKLIQKTHVSYSSYRRIKNFRIFFGKTEFMLLEGEKSIQFAVNEVNKESDYICPRLNGECDILLSFHSGITDSKNILRDAECENQEYVIKYLRDCHKLSYREIGKIMNCSSSKIYRLVNK